MGGMSDYVIGPTKISTWKAYQKAIAKMGLNTSTGQNSQGMFLQFPRNKRDAYRRMIRVQDGWQMWYYFHS